MPPTATSIDDYDTEAYRQSILDNLLRDHQIVHDLSVAPDGSQCCAVGSFGTVVTWQLGAGQPQGTTLRGGRSLQSSTVFAVRFLDASHVAVAGSDGVHILPTATPDTVAPVQVAEDASSSLAFVGSSIVVAHSRTVSVFDPHTGQTTASFVMPSIVHCVDTSGDRVAAACEDGTLRVWDLKEPSSVALAAQPVIANTRPLVSCAFSERWLAGGGPDGIRIAHVGSGTLVASTTESVRKCVFLGEDVLSIAAHGNVHRHRCFDGGPHGEFPTGLPSLYAVCAHTPSAAVLAAGAGTSVACYVNQVRSQSLSL